MECAYRENQDGFTLVEISIVMIIVGLLIGGTFGGMKLIENMQVNKTVQDLKAIESAALTFKDTYGRLPGDMPNTAARLPNCTVAPCATGGNGDRSLDTAITYEGTLTTAMERFTFWSHLSASDLLNVGTKNVSVLDFGEGQPEAPVGGGYRMTYGIVASNGTFLKPRGHVVVITSENATWVDPAVRAVECPAAWSIDRKIDDGVPTSGRLMLWYFGYCVDTGTTPPTYRLSDPPAMLEYFTRF